MTYDKIYEDLVNNAKLRDTNIGYIEKHHILPKCMGGLDTGDNIVELTAKEHFVAHHLLCKIYSNNYKLASAFNLMCCNPHTNKGKNRYDNCRLFNLAKQNFSKNNPMKNPEVVLKMRNTIKQKALDGYEREFTNDGLTLYRSKRYNLMNMKWSKYHNDKGNLHIDGFPLCGCCGSIIIRRSGRRDQSFCSYACGNKFRGGNIDENISETISKQEVYFRSLSIDDVYVLQNNFKK